MGYSTVEIACVKKLAEQYEKGEHYVMIRPTRTAHGGFVDPLDLPVEKRVAILGAMEGMGLISDPRHVGRLGFRSFKIASKAIQAARAIHEQETKKEEPRDIMDSRQKLRQTQPHSRMGPHCLLRAGRPVISRHSHKWASSATQDARGRQVTTAPPAHP